MSTTQRPPEPPPMEVLIPSLPNDVALDVLAGVPRQYHSFLSAVSKPIRSAVSSPQFFAVRSLINRTESIPYLIVGSYGNIHDDWFAVHRNPSPINNSNSLLQLAPVPRIPVETKIIGSAYAAVGSKIYVIGGYTRRSSNRPKVAPVPEFSSDVWVLDCRYHTWERGPSMLTPRFNAKVAVVDGKIWVAGGVDEKLWVEVLDPAVGRWEAIPGPLDGKNVRLARFELLNGMICVRFRKKEFWLDTTKTKWEIVLNEETFPTWRSVKMEGEERFEWFDEKLGVWKELKVAIEDTPKYLRYRSLIKMEDRLIVVFTEGRSSGNTILWCAEIDVRNDEDGNLWGRVHWSEKVPLLPQLNREIPEAMYNEHLCKCFFKCVSVSI